MTKGIPLTSMQLALISESIGSGRPWINLEQVVIHFGQSSPNAQVIETGLLALSKRRDALRLVLQREDGGRLGQSFEMLGDVPFRVVEQAYGFDETWLDALESFLDADRLRGFDLLGDALWRASLVHSKQGQKALVLTMHHAIADGRSMAQLARELLAYFQSGKLPAENPKSIDFKEFCQRISNTTPNEEAATDYFSRYLKDVEGSGELSLPDDGSIDPTDSRKRQLTASLTTDESLKLGKAAISLKGTTANMVQAAWGILLSRWQGADTVTFGVVRSGRHALPNSNATVGCLINTLPTCVKLSPDLTLPDLVKALRNHTLALHGLEQTPPDLIRQCTGLHGAIGLFETAIMFENGEIEALITGGEKSDLVGKIELREEAGMPLMLSVYAEDAIKLQLEYDPAVVSEPIAKRMFANLMQLMRALSKVDETTKVAALDMLPPDEKRVLLDWSRPDTPLGTTDTCLVRLFEKAVQIAPDAVAVKMIGESREVTFAQLDRRSNQLANVLLEQGAMPGKIVAVNLNRSIDFIVSILATLKTGAAFMPVDPAHPDEYRAHVLSDSAAHIIIQTDGVVRGGKQTPFPRDDGSDTNPVPRPAENTQELAYVIYTSGTTGAAKGVRVSRGNLLSHIAALTSAFEMNPADRALQFAGLSFDVAIEEIFTSLMSGATLVLRSNEMSEATSVFLDEVDAEKLSVVNLPTAYWAILNSYMQTSRRNLPPSVRLVVVGGEEIPSDALSEWLKVAPNARFLNGYGPTETTITCTVFEPINHHPDKEVCIGRPTAHALAYVIAPDSSLSPKGASGELAIGGPAVSQGYIGRPDETTRVFRPDVFGGSGNIYCTGDRGKWQDDGNLKFRGRQDRQIKLRGHRIELVHVERAVKKCIPEGEVLCDVLDKGSSTAQLVAWIALSKKPDLAEASERIAGFLPAYMRPSLVHVTEFARTPNGKVDRKSLPRPELHPASDRASRTTSTELERQICQIMAEVLKVPYVDPDQSFFDLGGHSLLSLELIGRIGVQTGKPLGVADFRENSSAHELSKFLEENDQKSKNIIPIQPLGNKAPLFAVHILGANEEYFRPLAKHLGQDQPVLGISVGSLDAKNPTSVEPIAARYCDEINQHFPTGPIHLMAASLGSYIAFELAQQLEASGRKVETIAFFDASGPDGRASVRGIGKLKARLRRARYVGWRYPAQVIQNLIHEMRNRLVQYQMMWKQRGAQSQGPRTVFEFIAANEIAVNDYVPKPITVPLTIFRSAVNYYDTDASTLTGLGWSSVAKSGFRVIDVPGGHLTMLQEPTVSMLADELKAILNSE